MVRTVDALRAYVRREGSKVGEDQCYWADEFAHKAVADALELCLLFVDMERRAGGSPYRVLASADAPRAVVVLKRSSAAGGHFVFLSHEATLVPPQDRPSSADSNSSSNDEDEGEDENAAGASAGARAGMDSESGNQAAKKSGSSGGGGSRRGRAGAGAGAGAGQHHPKPPCSRACFLAGELPDVVGTLWATGLKKFPALLRQQQQQQQQQRQRPSFAVSVDDNDADANDHELGSTSCSTSSSSTSSVSKSSSSDSVPS